MEFNRNSIEFDRKAMELVKLWEAWESSEEICLSHNIIQQLPINRQSGQMFIELYYDKRPKLNLLVQLSFEHSCVILRDIFNKYESKMVTGQFS